MPERGNKIIRITLVESTFGNVAFQRLLQWKWMRRNKAFYFVLAGWNSYFHSLWKRDCREMLYFKLKCKLNVHVLKRVLRYKYYLFISFMFPQF